MSWERLSQRATYYLGFGSAVSILFSIAISQILLALAIAMLLLSWRRIEFPPIRLPLATFFTLTLAALIASGHPQQRTPQLRKFFVFAIVLVIFSTFRTLRQVRSLIISWVAVASASALAGGVQFLDRRRDALLQNADNYGFVVDGRITGLASHWMTFGGEEMIVLLMLVGLLMFSDEPIWKRYLWPAAVVVWSVIALGMTRCIFLLGLPLGIMYLAFRRGKIFVIAFVIGVAVALALAPAVVRERIVSVAKPHSDIDSNAHRVVCRIVGWQTVKAHPWLGLGPEQIASQFNRYVPASVHRPLPRGWYGHLHNIYLQYAAERGVPALLSFLWLIAVIAKDFARTLRHPALTKTGPAILSGALATILACLAEGLFEYNLGDSEVLTLFLSAIACGYVVVRQVSRTLEARAAGIGKVEQGRCGSSLITA